MAGGRPTILTAELKDKARLYIQECEDEETEYHKTRGEKSDGFERIIRVRLPTIEGLALSLEVNRDTIYDWETKDEEFSDILSKLRSKQASMLIDKGLSGDYNPTIAKVLLTKHGYREGTEHSGVEGKDLIPDKQSTEKADAVLSTFLTNGTNQGTPQ
jgi:hypothetical protein